MNSKEVAILKKRLSDAESGEENNDWSEGEGESEGDAGSGDHGEGKSGGVGKSEIRAGRKIEKCL